MTRASVLHSRNVPASQERATAGKRRGSTSSFWTCSLRRCAQWGWHSPQFANPFSDNDGTLHFVGYPAVGEAFGNALFMNRGYVDLPVRTADGQSPPNTETWIHYLGQRVLTTRHPTRLS